MALTPEILPMLFAGIVHLGLAAALLSLGFHRAWNRAFALLLVILGMFRIVFSLANTADTPGAQAYWQDVLVYFSLTDEVALLYFASVYPFRRRWLPGPPWSFAPFLAAMLGLGALYVADHRLWFGLAQPIGPVRWPLQLVADALYVSYAVVPLVLLRDGARGGAAAQRHSVLLVGVALTLVYLHVDARSLGLRLLGFGAPLANLEDVVSLTGILLRLALFGVFVRRLAALRGGADAALRMAVRRYLVLMGLALLSAFAVAPLAGSPAYEPMRLFLSGSWFVAGAALVTYALMRHQLFDIDLRIKRALREGTVAGAFVAAYVVASVVAQRFLGGDIGPYVGVGAAVLLLFAIIPLQRLAVRVADAAMPRVDETPEYLNLRKLEVYRAALEESLAPDGTVAPAQAPVLARLRTELGVTDRDHAVLELAVRASRGPQPAGPVFAPGALVLGKYRLLHLLGEGSFGATYQATDTVVRRDVVIKVLHKNAAGGPTVLREARAIGAIRHPHVATLYDVEQVGDQGFIVMEHLEGGSLGDRLHRGALTAAEFRKVGAGLLSALGAVHAAGIVHRDVKPSNVLLTKDGQPKLADFGVAHIRGFESTMGGAGGSDAVGTIRFMSPEQAKGKQVTERSDLFSAAATLFEAYGGEPYLRTKPAESPVELQLRAARGRAFPATWEGPAAMRAWFGRALDPAPERRFASAEEMAAALEAALGS
jgi:hypothetical protein